MVFSNPTINTLAAAFPGQCVTNVGLGTVRIYNHPGSNEQRAMVLFDPNTIYLSIKNNRWSVPRDEGDDKALPQLLSLLTSN